MKAATSKEMQLIDKNVISGYGIPGIVLMENAAIQVVREMEARYGDLSRKRITVVAGKGNNGGDGLAIARHLINRGAKISVYLLAGEDSVEGDPLTNLRILKKMGGEVIDINFLDLKTLKTTISHSSLVVDTIFGTGLSEDVKGLFADVISLVNSAGKPVVSVDIPS
ncbi:MAG TPA: NAD(P)H-hydrate epimerase, partial [Nitrospiria bacterium]|nr:NAD(P)H-hydrate epimerase [Nitrospiria bacterium]